MRRWIPRYISSDRRNCSIAVRLTVPAAILPKWPPPHIGEFLAGPAVDDAALRLKQAFAAMPAAAVSQVWPQLRKKILNLVWPPSSSFWIIRNHNL